MVIDALATHAILDIQPAEYRVIVRTPGAGAVVDVLRARRLTEAQDLAAQRVMQGLRATVIRCLWDSVHDPIPAACCGNGATRLD